MTYLSWKSVLYCHNYMKVGDRTRMNEIAQQLDYPYFCWNDRIFRTDSGTGSQTTYSKRDVQ